MNTLFPAPSEGSEFYLGSLDKPISVGELTELIKVKLEGTFADVVVVGEISNFKAHPASGHLYFSLKDPTANLTAVMFKGSASRLKYKVQDGQRVVAFGRISVYPPRGNYQIVITRMEPEGMGALQLAFEQLKKKLEAEGFFDPARKRPIPKFPRCIGLVTASSGAAVRDMLNVLERRFSGIRICLYSVKVQGEGSAEEVARAIDHFNRFFSKEVDVLIVGRGGGSIEDLWAFNEEIVARAIFNSKIPVISAVGHEVDFTIADFVADLRAPTPSAAAELVIANKMEVILHVDHMVKRLLQVRHRLEFAEIRIDELVQKLVRSLESRLADEFLKLEQWRGKLIAHQPHRVLENYRVRLAHSSVRLSKALAPAFERIRNQIDRNIVQLKHLNPRAIMDRGYSIVRILKTKKVVKKAADVRMGDELLIELSKGQIKAKV